MKLMRMITVVGELLLLIFRKYWSPDAEKKDLKTDLRLVRKAMRRIVAGSDDWNRLNDERLSILEKLSNIRK